MGKYFSSLIIFYCICAGASQEETALAKTSEAVVKYNNIDQMIENVITNNLPHKYKPYAGYFSWVSNAAIHKKMEIKWNF